MNMFSRKIKHFEKLILQKKVLFLHEQQKLS